MTMKREPNLDERAAQVAADDIETLPGMVAEVRGLSHNATGLTPDQELWCWMYAEPNVNKAALIAGGVAPIDAEFIERPLKRWLLSQAGTKWSDVKTYSDKMAAREQQALTSGRLPKPPAREQLMR